MKKSVDSFSSFIHCFLVYSREVVTPHSIAQEAKLKLDSTALPGSCTCGLCILDRSKYLLHTFMLGDSKYVF